MIFRPEDICTRLCEFEDTAGCPDRYVIAFSGGLDSSVLLHALAATRAQHGKSLLAVHVNHRLQSDSGQWATQSEQFSNRQGVDFECLAVNVDRQSGDGPEAAARKARYAAFGENLGPKDWLLSAHHRDDLAETLLLNVLRGSGPSGVAGIPELRKFAAGWLARPLLSTSRAALLAYATDAGFDWINDPSNDESQFDRNFLRNEVLPLLDRRWPNASARIATSARLAREASQLLNELADADLQSLGDTVNRLDVAALRNLSPARQRNLLRRAIARLGLPPPPSGRLASVVDVLLPARVDASPIVVWEGAEVRRFDDCLYLQSGTPSADFDGRSLGTEAVELGTGMGRLLLTRGDGDSPGLPEDLIRTGLTLSTRKGGEEIKPVGQAHTRKLKKLLQDRKIVPWMRDKLPLIYAGDRLVAVADLFIANDVAVSDGWVPHWDGRPALH